MTRISTDNPINEVISKAFKQRHSAAERLSSDILLEMERKGIKINEDTLQMLIETTEQMWERLRDDSKFCYNIETKYKLFGIEGPVDLKCDKVENSNRCSLQNQDKYDEFCAIKREKQVVTSKRDRDGNDFPNVVIIGQTGIGKSF